MFNLSETQTWWIFAVSVAMFLGTLVAVPWMVVRIPADYFSNHRNLEPIFFRDRPVLHATARVLGNVLGVILILAGILMLVLPGQGILTMLAGFLLTSFPGKRRLGRWLVTRSWLRGTIDKLRHRAGKRPLELDEQGDGSS